MKSWTNLKSSFPNNFEIIGRMLIGLWISLRFLETCLNTSVTLGNLEVRNFDKKIHCMKSVQTQTYIGPYFPVFRPLRENYYWKKSLFGHFAQ